LVDLRRSYSVLHQCRFLRHISEDTIGDEYMRPIFSTHYQSPC